MKKMAKKKQRAFRAWAFVARDGTPLAVCFHRSNFPYYEGRQIKRCKVIVTGKP